MLQEDAVRELFRRQIIRPPLVYARSLSSPGEGWGEGINNASNPCHIRSRVALSKKNRIVARVEFSETRESLFFTLQTLPPAGSLEESNARVAKVAGFSLHVEVAAARPHRQKLEWLCCYVTRPAIAEPRLSLTPLGNFHYQLTTPYRNGTTHIIIELLDFQARLAALVLRPRVNLTPTMWCLH